MSGTCGGRCSSGRIGTTPRRNSPTLLELLAFSFEQRPVFGRMGGDQTANRRPARLTGPTLPIGVEFSQPGPLAALAAQIHRAHSR